MTMSGRNFWIASAYFVYSRVPIPSDVTIDIVLCVLAAEHGRGGIRRGPSMSNISFCKAMNLRRGDS